MSKLDVKIVKLESMRVICFNGFGESPEQLALEKLANWSKQNGKNGRVFGYNNPNPSEGSPNYGYDVWMTVDANTPASGEARIIDFPGGLYAVARCPVTSPWEDIPATWKALVHWRETSAYHGASHQWLEEHLDLQDTAGGIIFTLDLYLPISE